MPIHPLSSPPEARATPGIFHAIASHFGLILRVHIIPPLLIQFFLIRRPLGLLLKVWAVCTNVTSLLAIITRAFILVFLILLRPSHVGTTRHLDFLPVRAAVIQINQVIHLIEQHDVLLFSCQIQSLTFYWTYWNNPWRLYYWTYWYNP